MVVTQTYTSHKKPIAYRITTSLKVTICGASYYEQRQKLDYGTILGGRYPNGDSPIQPYPLNQFLTLLTKMTVGRPGTDADKLFFLAAMGWCGLS